MFEIVPTERSTQYNAQIYELLGRHFDAPNFGYDYTLYEHWRKTPFHLINFAIDEKQKMVSYGAFLITDEASTRGLIEGKIQEHEVAPYTAGNSCPGYLFWTVLVIEDKATTAHLLRGLFKETERACRTWKINITHVFAIAYNKLSERIMRKYGFEAVGLYQNTYPIMVVEVIKQPSLSAVIPNIDTRTRPPIRLA